MAQKADILYYADLINHNEIEKYIKDIGFGAEFLETENIKEKLVEFKVRLCSKNLFCFFWMNQVVLFCFPKSVLGIWNDFWTKFMLLN